MAENEERKRFWQIFYSPLVFIVLLVAFLFLARSMWKVYEHEKVSERDRQRVENELAAAQARQQKLQDQVGGLETPEGVDDEIRSKFNVVRPGEKVAVIIGSEDTAAPSTSPEGKKSWWQRLFGF